MTLLGLYFNTSKQEASLLLVAASYLWFARRNCFEAFLYQQTSDWGMQRGGLFSILVRFLLYPEIFEIEDVLLDLAAILPSAQPPFPLEFTCQSPCEVI